MTHYERVSECIRYQTDPHFYWEIRRYGCRVMTLLAIPQFVAGRCLSEDQVMAVIDEGRARDGVIVDVNPNDNNPTQMGAGRNEHWLIDEGFRRLGVQRRGRQVGWTPAHVETREWEYMIVHWETDGPDGHYTLFDRREVEIYDPHNARQAGYPVNKKRILRKLVYATWEA